MTTQNSSLKDKVAIVTGAASGIGKAAARAFADAGAKVVVADVMEAQAEKVAAEIRGMGGTALAVSCDVSRAADVERMIQKTVDRFGHIDCAFNNAGIEGKPAPTP